jgi:signal transduction histidine kinase
VLLLCEDGEPYVRATRTGASPCVLLREPLGGSTAAPERVVRYVLQTRGDCLLRDADGSALWQDAYYGHHHPRAVLCLPLMRQGKALGALYLEHQQLRAAFAPEGRELLHVLAAQAAVAIESAMLYATLEQRVEDRTRELRQAQDKLVRLEREATEVQMAGGFAHEMRNALHAARTYVEQGMGRADADPTPLPVRADRIIETLLDTLEPALPAETLQRVADVLNELHETHTRLQIVLEGADTSLQRGVRVTNLIMDYARLREEAVGSDTVDVSRVINHLLEEMRADLAGAGVRVTADIVPTCPAQGKEAHFYSVLSNLLLNARDAMQSVSDGRERHLHVSLLQHDQGLRLRVADNGVGMTPEVRARMGAPFFTTKGQRGTGLGMGTVKKLVTLYQGTLAVESEAGRGTTFVIDWPVRRSEGRQP